MSSIAAAPSAAGAEESSVSGNAMPDSLRAQSTAAMSQTLSPLRTASRMRTSIRRPPSSRPATSMSMRSNTRPATAASATTSLPPTGICAVLETRGIGREVGIAVMDQETGRVTLCQLADTQTYIKTIQHLSLTGVSVLLAPGNAQSTAPGSALLGQQFSQASPSNVSVLLQCIEEAFGVAPTYIHRRHWNEKEGAAVIRRFVVTEPPATEPNADTSSTDADSSIDLLSSNKHSITPGAVSGRVTGSAALVAVSSKYYALSAACALFRYLESVGDARFRKSSLCVEYRVLFIGTETAKSLELLENNLNKKSKQCLFGLMNFCATPMAERLLRMNLLQPLTDAVEEMVHSEERFAEISQSLKPLAQHKIDSDKLINQVCMAERTELRNPAQTETKITNVLALRTFVRSLRPAKHALDGCSSGLLRAVRMFLDSDELDEIAEAIESCINNDMLEGKVKMGKSGLAARNTKLYAVKSNRSALLDVARETYKENIKDIYDLATELGETHQLPIILKYAATGFVLELKTEHVPNQRDLPRTFINVVKGRSKTYTMSTLELKKRNQKMLDSMNEVLLLSNQAIEDLRQDITERVGALFKAIAILDMLASFAHLVTVQNCVRPELTNTLAVSNGRHPILARFPTQKLVSNDIYASEGQSFTLINGPNMSGKSTYLQQIALLVIMASVGCFVPADYASFPTYDAILTCECRSDNLAQQLSSFAAEMRATSFILSAATPRSLVLIDELGRATSTSEGFGFSFAVAEHLLSSGCGGCTTFWATHLTELNVVLAKHYNFCSKTFQVDVGKRGKEVSIDFRHRIVEGSGEHYHLGLQLARLAGVPKNVCDTAEKLAAELRESEERQRAKSKATAVIQRRKIILKLDALLRQTLESSRLPARDLRRFLVRLQDQATDDLYETYSGGAAEPADKDEPMSAAAESS
ncbi:MutS protein msh4 [Tilletia horrida]|nr:MutS protein msh4 [Tilletia horrida]